jgi:sugar lactone lactonase YvrE
MPRTIDADLAIPAQCELAEGPVWDDGRARLIWVDILGKHVHEWDPATAERTWFDAGDFVGAAGIASDGDLVLALVDEFVRTDAAGANRSQIRQLGTDRRVVRLNDGKPSPWGTFWAGTMPWEDGAALGALYELSTDGQVTTLVNGVGLSNGLEWSRDRRTFYFCDSASGGVDVFGTDPETGELLTGTRRRFVTIPAREGTPDGLTLDADGCLWLALFEGGQLRRFTPDGALDTVVRLPCAQVTSVAFGGPDLATMYITTAREHFTPGRRAEEPHAGDIFACEPGVPGWLPFRYAGLERVELGPDPRQARIALGSEPFQRGQDRSGVQVRLGDHLVHRAAGAPPVVPVRGQRVLPHQRPARPVAHELERAVGDHHRVRGPGTDRGAVRRRLH